MNVTTGEPFYDGEHIIYLNSSYKQDRDLSELAELAHDFLCNDPDEMYLPIMAETARYYKTNKKGVEHMCKSMEDRINAKAVEIALKMISKGKMTLEEKNKPVTA